MWMFLFSHIHSHHVYAAASSHHHESLSSCRNRANNIDICIAIDFHSIHNNSTLRSTGWHTDRPFRIFRCINLQDKRSIRTLLPSYFDRSRGCAYRTTGPSEVATIDYRTNLPGLEPRCSGLDTEYIVAHQWYDSCGPAMGHRSKAIFVGCSVWTNAFPERNLGVVRRHPAVKPLDLIKC